MAQSITSYFQGLFGRRRPVKADFAVLKAEIANAQLTSVRSILSDHPANDLTPQRLAAILRAAEEGDADAYLDLAEQMEERDLHYLSVLGTRKRQVAQLPITIDAASDAPEDQKVADFIREWLQRDALEFEMFDVLDAIGKGFSATEIVWNQDGNLWYPEALKYRLPRWFAFDRRTGEIPLLKGGYDGAPAANDWEYGGMLGVPLPPAKFLFHVHPAKSGLPIRNGLARPVAWAYLFKNYSLKDWVAFAEIYGRPFRIGKYPASSTQDQIETLMLAVAGMGEDAAAVIPDSMMIELVDSKAQGGDLYERLLQYLDRQISKAVLGQTATTDADTGGLGSGKEHGDVRADIERADARLLAASIQRDILTPMVRLNFGDAAIPKLKIGREEEWDAATMMPAIRDFVAMGGKVEASIIGDKLGLPDAPEGDDIHLLQPAAQPVAVPAEPGAEISPAERIAAARGPRTAKTPAPRFLDASLRSYSAIATRGGIVDLIAATVADRVAGQLAEKSDDSTEAFIASHLGEDWENLLGPMVLPLIEAIQDAGSYDDALDAMMAAMDRMDTGPLEAALDAGSQVSRGARLADDLPGD